ncbi:GTP cyclohydrolase II RibA [Amycolatopsis sp. SID8362]|uniref:GTP cyclohydrolase II RibA n=1 Tax=Amycolatopsis sp. SID8362 TaxID=2690346 RepID=UPI00136BF56B|nr:GTP cyclohydrolase II RibA [Amycolatopsis sp. SID8362]NBH10247.1 GTP cyclohydrolase II RibA [Amycolatopsis sp. SID8362]NED46942.1 GTP cyclohydrolase II RibA [Amycolatopsis sp. SID8362]
MTGAVVHQLEGAEGAFRAIVLDGGPGWMNPPSAAVYGEPVDGCPVRIHSRCLYGEIFESTNCDCRWQLQESLRVIRKHGSGVLVYLDQEGRGAGLFAKAEGYELSQKQGLDTFASYAALGYKADSRSYGDAAALLAQLGLTSVRLLTNNPAKISALEVAGIKAEMCQLVQPDPSRETVGYLAAKEVHGHAILPRPA